MPQSTRRFSRSRSTAPPQPSSEIGARDSAQLPWRARDGAVRTGTCWLPAWASLSCFAACGGSANPSNGVASLPSEGAGSTAQASATPTPNASDQYAQVLAYSECMRAHGITDFPDPQSQAGGGFGLQIRVNPGSDLDPNSPKFQAAQTACQSLMPAPKSRQAGTQASQRTTGAAVLSVHAHARRAQLP